jgi:hypothetical protein
MANTYDTTSDLGVYKVEFESKLQERLNYPQVWKEICNVIYTNSRYVNVPYMTTATVALLATTGTRGTAYTFNDFELVGQVMDIGTTKIAPTYVDRADLAQCTYLRQMEIADLEGKVLNEAVDTAVLTASIAATDVGISAGAIVLGTGAITVSSTNIDDIVRGVKRIINKANGTDVANRNGIFFVWRPEDLELLEAFAQANGFSLADAALKNGIKSGYHLMGADHYISNSLTSTHLFAGVKKLMTVGILIDTYGKLVVTQDPGLKSGLGFVSRVDYGTLIPTLALPLLLDINVAAIA